MPDTTVVTGRDVFRTVEVFGPSGHRSVLIEGLRNTATVAEIRARAQSELRLDTEVPWNLRQDRTGRLLQDEQRLEEIAEPEGLVTLKMQPDAGLG
jgi:hypothetical protein